jgi:hypothetical protein
MNGDIINSVTWNEQIWFPILKTWSSVYHELSLSDVNVNNKSEWYFLFCSLYTFV